MLIEIDDTEFAEMLKYNLGLRDDMHKSLDDYYKMLGKWVYECRRNPDAMKTVAESQAMYLESVTATTAKIEVQSKLITILYRLQSKAKANVKAE